MTISTTIIKNSYSGNGSNKAFTYNFKISDEDFIQVIVKTNATGAESVRSIGVGSTNYAVTGVGNNSGTVTFVTAPTSAETVVLRRSTTQTQGMDLIENDPLPANTLEDAIDKNLSIAQELQEQIDRSLKLSRGNTMTSTEFTTIAADRASKVLAFDSSGELSVAQELGTFKGNWAASTAYVQRDIIKDTSNGNIYLTNTAHTSSGSQPISSNTDVAKWNLIVDAAAATTSASAAATSATAAATSATAAATSATAATTNGDAQVTLATAQVALATTQANNSATSATASATSATAAASSATSAASSASSAAAALDSFDDVYLGSKSSAPSVDNDGDALTQGDLYYNTSANTFNYYNGSIWIAVTAGGITSLAADGSPQLGGDLDLNGRFIDFKPLYPVSNQASVGANTTTTLVSTRNYMLAGDITVADTYTWDIAGTGSLSIL